MGNKIILITGVITLAAIAGMITAAKHIEKIGCQKATTAFLNEINPGLVVGLMMQDKLDEATGFYCDKVLNQK